MTPRLEASDLSLGYDTRLIVERLSLSIPNEQFTAIVGPNACGKSTLLRAMARLLVPRAGQVLLDGKDVRERSEVDIARRLGLLPQTHTMPEGLKVADLVARGRFPHQSFLRRWSDEDDAAVSRALRLAGIEALAKQRVDELSGGQRQRVWLATVLAQDPPIVLLDEPTTYLDLVHQLDVLDLLAALPAQGHTVVAVLHDLNLAARYATHMIAMRHGRIVASGTAAEVITQEVLAEAFGLASRVIPDPETGTPMVVPLARERAAKAAQR